MRSKLISIILCIVVLAGTVFLVRFSMTHDFSEKKTEEETSVTLSGESEAYTKAYAEQCGYDLEDLIVRLAYQEDKEYQEAMSELAERLDNAAEYLKSDEDFAGATYYARLAGILRDVLSTPFTDNASFSTRVSAMLTEIENTYPADRPENDETLAHLPTLDTDANGKLTLAMLSVYNRQKKDQANTLVLTFGGNLVLGDTLLGAENDSSFKAKQENALYAFPFYGLSSVLLNDDVSFANLKAPLTTSITARKDGAVKGLPAYAALLKNGGMDVVSLSDGNLLNYGENGKTDTKNALSTSGVLYSDEGTVCYYPSKLGKVAYISYDITDECKRTDYTFDAPKTDIAAAKADGAVFVIVHFNWITTCNDDWDPSMTQALTAKSAVDNGANFVLGTYPGAIMALEQYNGVSILYSPGDLVNLNAQDSRTFLYQQSFSLSANGKAVPGEITLYPVAASAEDGSPRLNFAAASVDTFVNDLASYSRTMRRGLGKQTAFTKEHLHVISITK